MGIYDTVSSKKKNIHIQIKSTPDTKMWTYKVGDSIDLPEGIHVGYEGAFVVLNGKILKIFEYLYDKWGERIDPSEIVHARSPVGKLVEKELAAENVKLREIIETFDIPYHCTNQGKIMIEAEDWKEFQDRLDDFKNMNDLHTCSEEEGI